MSRSRIRTLINKNGISEERMDNYLYDFMVLTIFEQLCYKMKDPIIKQDIKTYFHRTDSYFLAVKDVVIKYTGCEIGDQEAEILFKLLIAHFRKIDRRKSYPISLKKELLLAQHCRCNICSINLDVHNSELDHIIPWDFVGDELENNLQLLCTTCNERKGRKIDFHLRMLLINN